MEYTVKGVAGKRRALFSCPTCTAALESPLEEAGQPFACPTCAQVVTTPGVTELRLQVAEAKAAEVRKAQDAARKSTEERERQRQWTAQRAREEAALQERARARADAKTKVPAWRMPLVLVVASLLMVVGLLYGAVIRPLQKRVAEAERSLDALRETVNANAETANRNTRAVAHDLDSLTETVNYNARIANLNRYR